ETGKIGQSFGSFSHHRVKHCWLAARCSEKPSGRRRYGREKIPCLQWPAKSAFGCRQTRRRLRPTLSSWRKGLSCARHRSDRGNSTHRSTVREHLRPRGTRRLRREQHEAR